MESLGLRDKIQISQETANLLIEGGHGDMIVPRISMIHAKGKGDLQTYWFVMDDDFSREEEEVGKAYREPPQNEDNMECISRSSSSSSIFALIGE
jgi:hypothetical protein